MVNCVPLPVFMRKNSPICVCTAGLCSTKSGALYGMAVIEIYPSAVPRKVLGNVVYSSACENPSISVR
jgi:hypothetical protein